MSVHHCSPLSRSARARWLAGLVGFIVLLAWWGWPAALAQEPAVNLHMSLSPGGAPVLDVGSGTAKVYAVLNYRNMPGVELKVRIFGTHGAVVFERAAPYTGSGQHSMEVGGRDILAGYIAAARRLADDLEAAVRRAQQASDPHDKRLHTQAAVQAAHTLDPVLTAIMLHSLPRETLTDLREVQSLVAGAEEQGRRIVNGDVPDDELGAALANLEGLAQMIQSALERAVVGIDTRSQRPLLDGSYTSSLYRNDLIAVGFDWQVSPEGTPGTPVPPTVTPFPRPTNTPPGYPPPGNRAPRIRSLTCEPCRIWPGGVAHLAAEVVDPDGDRLYARWEASPRIGTFITPGPSPTPSRTPTPWRTPTLPWRTPTFTAVPTSTPVRRPTFTPHATNTPPAPPTPTGFTSPNQVTRPTWEAYAEVGTLLQGPDQFHAHYIANFIMPPGHAATIDIVLTVRDTYGHSAQGLLEIQVEQPLSLLRTYFPLVMYQAFPLAPPPTPTPSMTPTPSKTPTPLGTPPAPPTATPPYYPTPTPWPRPTQTPAPPLQGLWTTIANGDDIRGLAMTGNVVWAGTHQGGAVAWDPFDGTYVQYLAPQTGLASNDVRAVASDGLYTVWFATSKGVSQFEPGIGRWRTYTTSDGLPSNNATAVAYGPDGWLWTGTSQVWNGNAWVGGGLGVCELDGRCVTYTVDDGLPSNNITDIVVAGRDVWVATQPYRIFIEGTDTAPGHWVYEGGGAARLSGGTWTIFRRGVERINAVATGPDGRVWFATPSGLAVYEPVADVWRRYGTSDGLESNAVRDVTVDAGNRVWAITYDSESTPIGALNVLEGETWTIYTDDDGLSSKVLWTVLADEQQRIWVGTGPWCRQMWGCEGGGLTEYRPADNTWQVYRMSDSHLAGNQIADVAEAGDGALWIATFGSGLSVRDAGGTWHHFTTENSELTSNLVRSVAIAGDGAVWIGTQPYVEAGAWAGGGINVYRNGEWTTYNKDNSGLPGNEVQVIEIDDDGLVWIGTGDLRDGSGAGLVVHDPARDTWTIYTVDDGLPSNLITDIAFDSPRDCVWVATAPYRAGDFTGGGLAVFENGAWTSYTAANSDIPTWSGDGVTGDFRAVVVDADGTPWAGTYDTDGLLSEVWPYVDGVIAHLEGDGWAGAVFPEQGFTSSLVFASDGSLWAGIGQDGQGDLLTRGGLRARIDGTWYAAATATSGLAGNDITSLALAPNGGLWVGTRDAGLSLFQGAWQSR